MNGLQINNKGSGAAHEAMDEKSDKKRDSILPDDASRTDLHTD